MTVRIQEADFDLGAELRAQRASDARVGALASFVNVFGVYLVAVFFMLIGLPFIDTDVIREPSGSDSS